MWFSAPKPADSFFDRVQKDELKEVAASRKRRKQPPVANDLTGVAFSGGGIRSATFNLGILQALAEFGFLRQIDFLSTVSGGGYIGGWLVAWMRRAGCKLVEERLRQNVQPAPEPGRYLEPDQVRFLREYSMYLAPRSGLLSADIWAALAIYLRNLILNLTLLIAFGSAVLLVPDLILWAIRVLPPPSFAIQLIILLTSGTAAALAVGIGLSGLSNDPAQRGWKGTILKHIGVFTSVPLFATAVSGATLMSSAVLAGSPDGKFFILGGAIIYFIFWLVAGSVRHETVRGITPEPVDKQTAPYWNIAATLLSGALAGYMTYWIARLFWCIGYSSGFDAGRSTVCGQTLLLVFAPPLLVATLLLTIIFHIGLAGRALPDAKREWAARAAAILSLLTLGMMTLFAVTLYGPFLLKWLISSSWAHAAWGKGVKWLLAALWAAISGAGVLAGKSAATNGENGKLNWLSKIAPLVFAAGSFLLLSFAIDSALSHLSPTLQLQAASEAPGSSEQPNPDVEAAAEKLLSASSPRQMAVALHDLDRLLASKGETARRLLERHFDQVEAYLTYHVWALFAVCVALTLLLMWRVDVNEFSMHLFYRNRLVRTFLGASQTCRRADPFTGFAEDDDVGLQQLTAEYRRPREPLDLTPESSLEYEEDEAGKIRYDLPYDGPYPIFCTALNLVRGKELAWQKRKAASFIYTPLYCGYDHFESQPDPQQKFSAAAYRPTRGFGNSAGPMVGTAMAISGAAASPNMGYHTSPGLAFMMAIFNVRLGWWVGNPRHPRTWRNYGPRWGLLYLLRELFPSTNDEMAYVYLSDGGHFENLGLYELVRRNCRYIVASDADCDPNGALENLGNAIEKCRTDLGVNIDIPVDDLRPDPITRLSRAHFAMGTIHYQQGQPGYLLFVKSGMVNDNEPTDVVSYQRQHPVFPHDTTADQFFNESQFESYRALGQHIIRKVIEQAGRKTPATVGELFQGLVSHTPQ
jgi:hypothetical protein